MGFTSRNITYNLNSEVAWQIGFDEIPGKLWNEYSTEEKKFNKVSFH